MIKNILVIILAAAMILFVLVPLSFMALGKIENPFSYQPISAFSDPDNISNAGSRANNIDCKDPEQSLEPHTRDAILDRNEDSTLISSNFYKFNLELDEPITDWQYTEGKLQDEVTSFVYKDTIIHILARSSVSRCAREVTEAFENFHEKNMGVQYFASNTYVAQGASIGLTSSELKNHGKGDIGGVDFHWYLLEEKFGNLSAETISTIWYSTRVGRIEYWFGFRTSKQNEDNLNKIAEEVIENINFKKF